MIPQYFAMAAETRTDAKYSPVLIVAAQAVITLFQVGAIKGLAHKVWTSPYSSSFRQRSCRRCVFSTATRAYGKNVSLIRPLAVVVLDQLGEHLVAFGHKGALFGRCFGRGGAVILHFVVAHVAHICHGTGLFRLFVPGFDTARVNFDIAGGEAAVAVFEDFFFAGGRHDATIEGGDGVFGKIVKSLLKDFGRISGAFARWGGFGFGRGFFSRAGFGRSGGFFRGRGGLGGGLGGGCSGLGGRGGFRCQSGRREGKAEGRGYKQTAEKGEAFHCKQSS